MKRFLMTLTLLMGVLSVIPCTAGAQGKGRLPRYKAEVAVTPSGEKISIVYVFIRQEDGSENKRALLSILTVQDAHPRFTSERRAKIIAQRATEETARDPEWFKHLHYTKVNGDWVLKTDHGVFMALDHDYLEKLKAKNGIRKDEAMLHEIIKEIVDTLDPNNDGAWGYTR